MRKSVTGIKKRRKRLETVPSVPAPSAFPQSAPGSVASSFPELTATSINTSSTSSILGRKRKEADTEDTPVDIGRDSHTRFAALRPRLRHVQQDVIKTKWEVLPESVQERVREVFKSVERPVIYKHREERRKIEAQVAVGSIVRTLGKRLPRMPFPPNTKEVQFNYESLLEGNRDLEKRLTPTLHSIALLSDAINKAEEAIAISRDDLAELEMNAKAELGLSQRLRAKVRTLLFRLE
ncbi:hypothetical protein MMC24_007239 [Lignoscripta atroalba]|nr:hypothetical protein [Lignoscripta atroalba]